MGNCCSPQIAQGGLAQLILGDKVKDAEKELSLYQITITDWAAAFAQLIEQSQISCDALAGAFPENCEFAQKLFSGNQGLHDEAEGASMPVKLVTHACFQSRSGNGLDPKKVFSLGFLYCQGKSNQMVEAIFSVYDRNNDGTIFVNAFKKIIRMCVQTAICIMPQIVYKIDDEEADNKTFDDVENISQDIMVKLFGDNLQRTKKDLMGTWKKDGVGNLISNPGRLRERSVVKLGAQEDQESVKAADQDHLVS